MMRNLNQQTELLAKKIKLLVLDVDGVLTDGKLYFSSKGEETKAFNTLDGQGIKLLQKTGITVALITGRQSEIVTVRAKELGITNVFQGRDDKENILKQLIKKMGMKYENVAYVGDDLPDLACIKLAQLGVSVPNGHFLVQEAADVITTRHGGEGAVREICDWILQAQGNFDAVIRSYL